jgi:8-oxo-dGTP pyrophosphatase MutT (NUDIX family)
MIQPTHAGAIVYRLRSGVPEFLLVTARRRPHEWVYPKGHIESGESAEQTAVREVEEEAGVRGVVVQPLHDVTIEVDGEPQLIRYFLMTTEDEGRPREGRRASWLSATEALERLPFAEARTSLREALDALRRHGTI